MMPIDILKERFAQQADPEKAQGMARYMRNLFPFVGINSPTRKEISKFLFTQFKPQNPKELSLWVLSLWEMPEREYQYVGMDYLQKFGNGLTPQQLPLFETLITQKSWWDTVDLISGNYLGALLKKHPEYLQPTILSYSQHQNFWLNRTAIICQLGYRQNTQTDLLTQAITPHLQSNEFFIQKAIGWSLRQYAKTNPEWVRTFIREYPLKPLSRREALKHLK
jgi:3-methyladenine DNA glycosylase AlkD